MIATQEIVSRSEFARLVGVSKPAITKAARNSLAPACVGRSIDTRHAAAQAYINRHAPTKTAAVDVTAPAFVQLSFQG